MHLPKSSIGVMRSLDMAHDQLLALSDDLWLDIEHNEEAALAAGIALKREVNEIIEALVEVVGRFAALAHEEESAEDAVTEIPFVTSPEVSDNLECLGREFSYTSPKAFVLEGKVFQPARTKWSELYMLVLKVLRTRDEVVFRGLATSTRFRTNRGRRMFSSSNSDLRKAIDVGMGVLAETNLYANQLAGNISDLMDEFGIAQSELKVQLVQPRPSLTLANLGIE